MFKALALGAKMVFLGRPIIWGLTTNGQEGVEDVVRIVQDELRHTMVLSGCSSLNDIDESFVIKNN